MLAPVLYYDRNAEFLISASEDLERKANVVVRSCEGNKDYPDFLLLKQSAFKFSSEIALLIQQIKDSTNRNTKKNSLQNLLDEILFGMEQLSVEAMDSDELKNWSKNFTSNLGKLLTLMKDDINNAQDDDMKNELLASAKAIAEVTRHLLDNSKVHQLNLVNKALQAGKINPLEFMESQKKNSSEVYALLRNNFPMEMDDIQSAQLKVPLIQPKMKNIIKKVIAASVMMKSSMVNAVESCRSEAFARSLLDESDDLSLAWEDLELMKYLAQLEDIEDPLRVNIAKQRIQEAYTDLVVLADNFEKENLEKYPGENKDIFNKKLLEIYRESTKIMAQLSDPQNFENNAEICVALEKLSLTLCRIISPATGFASCCTHDKKERDECKKIIENLQAIMQASINCCSETEKKLENNKQDFHYLLLEALKQNSQSLVNLLSSLPINPDLEKASTAIENVNKEYDSKKPSPPLHHGKTYLDVQKQFSENLSHILESIAELLKFVSRNDVEQFSPSFFQFSAQYAKLHRSIKSLISCHPDKHVAKIIEDNLSTAVQLSNQLVSGAKLFVCDPNSSNQLLFTEVAKSFSDILSNILLTILSAKPGLRECEHAKKIMKLTYLPMLEASNREFFSDRSYNESVGEIEDVYTKNFSNIQKNLNTAVQNETSISCIGKSVQDWENLLAIILKNTSHASYLLGMNDSSTVSGRATIFDEDQIKSCLEQLTKAFAAIPTNLKSAKQTDIDAFSKECLKASSCLISSCKESVDALNGQPALQKEILDIASNLTSKTKESISNLKKFNLCKNDTELKKLIQTNKELVLSEIIKLHLFMESPALECIPARIADRGRLLQDPVITEGKNVINSMVEALTDFCCLVQQMDDHTRVDAIEKIELNKKSIESLIEVLKSQAPGEVELAEIIARLEENHSYIDKIYQQVVSGIINISSDNAKEYESRFKLAITKIIEDLNEIASLPASKLHLKSEKLKIIVDIVEGIPEIIAGLALSYDSIDQKEKSELFTQLLTLNDSFIQCANSSRIIPQQIQNKNPVTFKAAIESSLKESQKLSDMISALSQKSSGIQTCIQALEKLNSMLKVEGFPKIQHTSMEQRGFEKQVIEKIKNLHKISQDIVGKSTNRSDLIQPRCKDLIDEHEKCSSLIFDNCKKQFPDNDLKEIRKKYIDLSGIMHDFLVNSNSVCTDPSNSELKKDLSGTLKKISHSVSDILKLFQSQHKGAVACTILSESIIDSVNDIDTCILFAENGCLEKETDVLDMNSVKSKIMDNSCKLSEIINKFSKSNKYYDSNILEFTNSLEKNLKEFLEENKSAAVSLGAKEGENQISLLNATKNIGTSMVGLLDSLKTQNADSETDKLKVDENIKVTDEFIQAHKRIFNNVEKNISSGSEAAVHVISHIESMIPYLDPRQPCPWDNSLTQVKPEDLVRISKDIPLSCAKIVQAAHLSKAKDVEEIANKGDATFETLIKGARKLATVSNDPTVRSVGESLDKCARSYVEMLKLLETSESPTSKRLLSEKGKKVTEAVMEFAKKCSVLKSNGQNFVDMNDPNVLAEQELLNAANAIELAAQKLSELKPRPLNRGEGTNKELNFEGQILDAANSIMKATSFLIAAATSAQKELVQKGVFTAKVDDKSGTGQWSQGLISAARLVADSTNMLCDAAKAAVEGKASEEKLIAACNAISGSTSQLIMACKVKADPNSENQARLEKAGNSVKKASKTFVESLQGSGVFDRKQENIELATTKVGGMKQEIDALEVIAKHERELKEARDKLIKLRQAKAAPKKDQ
ncbi:hypothetical protein MXB_4178 [Myxobolus squamalis]|nr:hypothetical protein MXB_4178 [Myxobolus squamalis]